MLPLRKIAIIGASLQFVPTILRDAIHKANFTGDFAICDRLPEKVEMAGSICRKIVRQTGAGIEVLAGGPEVLDGAGVVIIIVSTEQRERILEEADLFAAHGLYYSLMDSYGLPLVRRLQAGFANHAGIAAKIAARAPEALVVNISNPMSLLTRYLQDLLPGQTVFGLCSGYSGLRWLFADIQVTGGILFGFNHCNFIAGVETPAGMLPAEEFLPHLIRQPWTVFSQKAIEEFGYPLLLGDTHALEFFPEWHGAVKVDGPLYRDYWEQRFARYRANDAAYREWAFGTAEIPEAGQPTEDPLVHAIVARLEGEPFRYAINDRNGAGLPCISPEAITEYVVDYRAPDSAPLPLEIPPALAEKLREMDQFYNTVYHALPAGELEEVLDATAYIYRNTTLTRVVLAQYILG